jgi:murein DD-endopeptidase MepM/ murein hydrolase activator NlpD
MRALLPTLPASRWTGVVCSLLLGAVLLQPGTAADPPDQRCWPLALESRYLTGNFMEPRGGRFHAGLDLKTYSRTGYPVLAAEDGWVSRIRFTATGYGQALYLSTPAGTTYVYAHLERLRDDLRARVAAEQARRGRWDVDLWFGRDEVAVRCGEVLALSGQSAAGGPHLHFELRGPDNVPRDPLAHGFPVRDVIAPEILAVRAVGAIDGVPVSWRHGDGKVPLGGRLPELRLDEGTVHFTALIVERSDRQRHLLYPWRVRLLLDDREVFAKVNDSLPWEVGHHQRLEFVRTALGQESWLWRDPRNQLPGRGGEAWLAAGAWPAGSHELRLIAEDRAGNRAEVAWRLVIAPGKAGGGGGDVPGWVRDADVRWERWLVDTASATAAGGEAHDGALQWTAAPLLEPLPDRFWRLSGLRPLGRPVQWRPAAGLALLETVTVAWPPSALPDGLDPADTTLAVYRLQRRAWVHAGSLQAAQSGPVFALAQPGVYQIMRDGAAPVIATASVERELQREAPAARAGISLPRWPVVRVPVADHGSGVDWRTLAVTLDGEPLIAEPDPPRDRILVELPDSLGPGTYRLEIAVADRAGHRARAGLDLVLRDP